MGKRVVMHILLVVILYFSIPLHNVQAESIATREDAIKMILQRLDIKPIINECENVFIDISEGDKNISFIQYARSKGYIHGYSREVFGYGKAITFRELISIIMNIYGYEDTYNNGISQAINDKIINKELCPINDNKPLSRKDITVILDNLNLKVIDVQLMNLKEIRITFSIPPIQQQALDRDNYKSSSINLESASIRALSDREYIIYLSNQLEIGNTELDLEIRSVVSYTLKELENTMVVIPIKDVTKPKISSIKSIGTYCIEVNFSEPINIQQQSIWDKRNNIQLTKISGSKVFIEDFDFRNNNKTLYIMTASSLKDNRYNISIKNFEDLSGLIIDDYYDTLKVSKQTEDFIVVSSSIKNDTCIEIVMNKPVHIPNRQGVYHTNKNSIAQRITYGKTLNQLFIYFSKGNELPPITFLRINEGNLTDLYDNTNKQSLEIKVKDNEDHESPMLLGIDTQSDTELKISYNEYLDKRQCERKSNFSLYLKDKKGKLRSSEYKITVNKRYITLTLRNHTTEDIDSIQIKGIEDLYSNRTKESERFPIN